MRKIAIGLLICVFVGFLALAPTGVSAQEKAAAGVNVYAVQEGFVDVHGMFIYYKTIGRGAPLMIVHGGPGASHDYFLPYLLPLAAHNRLIFIDERGSGRSGKLEDPKGYTVENMVEDVETVRVALGLGKISLLGHSYGGSFGAGVCAEVPAEPDALDSVQHFFQHEGD